MTLFPSWYYDDRQQVGVNFEDQAQVAMYDRNQGSNAQEEQLLLDHLSVKAGDHIIEFGTGTGSFALQAAKRGAYIYAIDVSQTMLAYASQQARAAGIESIEFHHGGFLTYEHAAAPVDVIVTKFALHHLSDFWKMVSFLRMDSMLKVGGTLYLRDVVFSFEPAEYCRRITAWIDRMEQISGFTRKDFETHVREEHSTFGWILEGMLTRASFAIEEATYQNSEYAEYICRKVGA